MACDAFRGSIFSCLAFGLFAWRGCGGSGRPLCGLLQRLVEHGLYPAHGRVGESGVELLAVQSLPLF